MSRLLPHNGSYLLIKWTIVVTKCQLLRCCYNVSIKIGIMNMDITLIKVMSCLPRTRPCCKLISQMALNYTL